VTRPQRGRAEKLATIARRAEGCTNCDLYRNATQTVFGEGSPDADLMLVGEQPGDKEDLEGRPFVGPAGKVLADGLAEAGIDRDRVYITNVVKHFKWRPAGKVRLHQKPSAGEIRACKPWLVDELVLVDPRLVVLLGATAAQAMLGSSFRVTQRRGELVDWEHKPLVMATIHPSAVLRADDRRAMFAGFVHDLTSAAGALEQGGSSSVGSGR
jgi:uracil-DNA glycosylase